MDVSPVFGAVFGDLHTVVQVLECHGHGLKWQYHSLPFQLLPAPEHTLAAL